MVDGGNVYRQVGLGFSQAEANLAAWRPRVTSTIGSCGARSRHPSGVFASDAEEGQTFEILSGPE